MAGRGIDLGDVVLKRAGSKTRAVDPAGEGSHISETSPTPVIAEAEKIVQSADASDDTDTHQDKGLKQEIERTGPIRQTRSAIGDGLRALRGPRKTSSGTLFNLTLDEPTNERLKRASFESNVKKATIVRAAIDEFLKNNGY